MKLQIAYTLPELAQLTGWSVYRCESLLREQGIKLHKQGKKKRVVMLSEIRKSFPEFWDSLLDKIRMDQF